MDLQRLLRSSSCPPQAEAAGVRSCPPSPVPRPRDSALDAADLSVTGRRLESRHCPTSRSAVNRLLCSPHKGAIQHASGAKTPESAEDPCWAEAVQQQRPSLHTRATCDRLLTQCIVRVVTAAADPCHMTGCPSNNQSHDCTAGGSKLASAAPEGGRLAVKSG